MIYIFRVIIFTTCLLCSQQFLVAQASTQSQPQSDLIIKVETFETQIGWGYDLWVDGKKYVHQTHIPAINGVVGFATEKDALKVGRLAENKILQNIIPPTISVAELDSLGVIPE